MSSAQRNVDFVLEQLGEAFDISARKMFGEYAIYSRGKVVALFCDDQLFVKPTAGGKAFVGKVEEVPPYPGAKPWFLIAGDRCEDSEWLSELIRITERELPAPKAKVVKVKGAKTQRKATTAKRKAPTKKTKPKAAKRAKPAR